MVRAPISSCEDKNNNELIKRGPWTPEEDQKLIDCIDRHGHGSWRSLPKLAGLNRCGKSCRLRWTNYLRPDIKRGKFSEEEERMIINFHSVLGNKWSRIASHLPGRTDNEIKNFWNTNIRKKLIQMGVDPQTHKPITTSHDLNHLLNLTQLIRAAQLSNLMTTTNPWDNTTLRLQVFQNLLQVINGNPNLPIPTTTLLGTQNLSVLQGLVNGAACSNNLYSQFPSFTSPEIMSHIALPQQPVDHDYDLPVSIEESLKQNNNNYNFGVQHENQLPGLISVYPDETSNVNQMESNPSTADQSLVNSLDSNVFEEWEKLIMDEECDSYWKDFLE